MHPPAVLTLPGPQPRQKLCVKGSRGRKVGQGPQSESEVGVGTVGTIGRGQVKAAAMHWVGEVEPGLLVVSPTGQGVQALADALKV